MNGIDKQHKELIEKILSEGHQKNDRTGVGSKSIFGHQMRFKMSEGFPLLTLRKIHTKSIIHEMLWFLGAFDEKWDRFGNTNIRYLLDNGVTFWSEWPYEHYLKQRKYRPELPEFSLKEFEIKIMQDDKFAMDFGSIGPGYGKQWTNCGGGVDRMRDEKGNTFMNLIQGVNQIDGVIEDLKKNPDSRRIIVDSWNPVDVPEMLLPCCHMMFQFFSYKMDPDERVKEYSKWLVENKLPFKETMSYYKFPERKLQLQFYIRSNDVYLGQPFNIAEYALLLHMMAQVVNMIPDELILTIGDAHLYTNSFDAANEISKRDGFPLPKLILNRNIESIYDFRFDDIKIEGYKSHPNIKVEVAV